MSKTATVVGYAPEIAEQANAEKQVKKAARQRKASHKQATSNVKFVHNPVLHNNPFADALKGYEV